MRYGTGSQQSRKVVGMIKKLLLLVGLSALAYWFVRDRLGGDDFEFTEIPADDVRAPEAQPAP